MRKMKDSGVSWVGSMPEHWEIVNPKSLFSLRKDKAIPGQRRLTASQQYGVIYQDEYMMRTGSKVVVVEKDFDILKQVKSGDFVISMRSFQGGIEYSTYDGSISSAYIMLIPDGKKVHHAFYKWLLKSSGYISALQSTSNLIRDGQAMRYSNFAKVPLPSLPMKEQQAIANFLDSKCAEIDALMEDIRAEISTLVEYKKSVITEAVTKGLNPDAEMKDSGVAWVGKCPMHWKAKKLKYTVTYRAESALFSPDKDTYIGLENLVGWSNNVISSDTQYEQSIYSVCRKGDVMYNKLRPNLGKAIIAPYDAFCTGELMIFSSFTGDKRFLRYWLINPILVNEVTMSTYGAKMPRANPDFIYNLPILIPSTTEQKAIADYLDAKCAEIDSTISDKQEQLAVLEEYKKSIIYEYVTGKKEVP